MLGPGEMAGGSAAGLVRQRWMSEPWFRRRGCRGRVAKRSARPRKGRAQNENPGTWGFSSHRHEFRGGSI